jgi:hypothetical protein
MKKVVVIIPIYKNVLLSTEIQSLEQCIRILGRYPLVFIKPKSLDISQIQNQYSTIEVRELEDAYFKSVDSYNKLMLSTDFYQTFLDFKYGLIYQLDAYVFRDELENWCDEGYDYIGAPWIKADMGNPFVFWLKKKIALFFKLKHPNKVAYRDIIRANSVGNGGFSLRNIPKSLEIVRRFQKEINYYTSSGDYRLNEDVFWGVEVNRYKQNIRIPDYKTALRFAFEEYPEIGYREIGEKLPFGCHAWERYNPNFWSQFIEKR